MSLANRKETHDWLIKLLLIGDSGVGKTNILLRFCENNFHPTHLTTIGIDFKLKMIEVDGKKIKMQIWDTAGQERFKTITQTYYKGAMGIILVYAVNDRETFTNISNWMQQIKNHASENVCKLIIANKCDLTDRVVTKDEGEALAREYKVPFYETSAKEGQNISDAFFMIAKNIKDNILTEKTPNPSTSSKLQASNPELEDKKKQSGCC